MPRRSRSRRTHLVLGLRAAGPQDRPAVHGHADPPAELDAGAQHASTLTGARIALTKPAAKALRSALKLKRTPSTKALGKLSVAYKPPSPELVYTPAPAPTVTAPAATATPAPTATPTPGAGTSIEVPAGSCDPARLSATPAGSVDWFGCDLPGYGDLRSWTRLRAHARSRRLLGWTAGTIVASGGASRLISNSAYDHRFRAHAGRRTTSPAARRRSCPGTITYVMPAHGIDEPIGDLEIEIAPGGLTGTVHADGRSAAACGHVLPLAAGTEQSRTRPSMNLDPPVTSGHHRAGSTCRPDRREPSGRLGGGEYPAGQPWGTFTIVAPTR